jgi:serine/threonine protein kinase
MENILFDAYLNVRIIDLSLGKQFAAGEAHTTTICGSPPYCAPEIFQSLSYGKPVDVWGLGVCLYGMLFGKLPFESEVRSFLMDLILHSDPLIPMETPRIMTDLISRMLKKSPSERITIQEVAQHPWIRNSVWAVYFEKGFRGIEVSVEDEQEMVALLRNCALDPLRMHVDGSEEALLRGIAQRGNQTQIFSSPEMFFTRSGRLKLPAWDCKGGVVPQGLSDGSARPAKVSLLENLQQQTGVALTKRVTGPGRVWMRPTGRRNGLCLNLSLRRASDT